MKDIEPKYPGIHVKLIGEDGNAHNILGIVMNAMREDGLDDEAIEQFHEDATSGDYDNLLCTCMEYVEVH